MMALRYLFRSSLMTTAALRLFTIMALTMLNGVSSNLRFQADGGFAALRRRRSSGAFGDDTGNQSGVTIRNRLGDRGEAGLAAVGGRSPTRSSLPSRFRYTYGH